MADPDLRKRLATAAFIALDEETLDLIHNRLMSIDGAGKIPLALKYEFTCDEDGVLGVDITARCNVMLQSYKVSLTTDGAQLTLFREVAAPVDEEADEDEVEAEEETVEAVRPAAPKKAAKKRATKRKTKTAPKKRKAAAKRSTKPDPAPAADDTRASRPATPAPTPASDAGRRLTELAAQNEEYYRTGVIDRTQAKMAGVDVDSIDAARDSAAGVPDLTPDELEALAELNP